MSEHKHSNIYVALASAQMEMGNVTKGSVNPHFRSRYADLADVTAAVVPILASHGIATFYTISDNAVVTTMMHGESETSISCALPLIVAQNNMQGLGSAITYARRYGLMALSGVAPEDDDGNDAAKHAQNRNQQPQHPTGPSREAVEAAKERLRQCQTMVDLKEAFIRLKAQQPMIAALDEVYRLKEDIKGALSVERRAAE
jgi:hypothetical protein